MALSEATVTLNVHDYVGDDFDYRRTKLYATTNIPDATIHDLTTGETRVGSGKATIAADGSATITVWVPGGVGVSNPASWQTTISLDYADPASTTRVTRSFGPFTITADALLTDLVAEQEVPPEYLTTVTDALQGYVTESRALLDAQTAISGIDDTDSAVAGLITDDMVGPLTNAALADAIDARAQRITRPDANLAFKKGDYNRAPTTQGAYNVIGIDTVNDKPYCRDDGNGVLRMCLTVDSLGRPLTWSNDKGFPAGTSWYNAVKILTFGGKLYLLTIQDSSGLPAIYRADPQTGNTALTWSTPLTLGKTGSTPRPACFNASSTYLYFADYGDPSGGPDVRRSTDGTIWGTTTTFSTSRHIHCIAPDPYAPGEVWVAMGDGVTGPNRRSTDNGATFHVATDAPVQLTELSFTPTDVWGTDDTAYVTAVTINKTTETWAGVSNGFHGNIAVPAFSNTGYWDPPSMAAGTYTSTTVSLPGAVLGVPVVASYRGALPAGVVISAAVTATDTVTVTLFNGTTGTIDLAAQNITVGTAGLSFAPAIFFGVVDPATEIFYMTTEQSVYYPYGALFAILQKGGAPVLLDFGSLGNTPVFIWNGRVFYGGFNRPLLGLRA